MKPFISLTQFVGQTNVAAPKFGPNESEVTTRRLLKTAPRRCRKRLTLTFTVDHLYVTDMRTKQVPIHVYTFDAITIFIQSYNIFILSWLVLAVFAGGVFFESNSGFCCAIYPAIIWFHSRG